jgi:hypothetical protein
MTEAGEAPTRFIRDKLRVIDLDIGFISPDCSASVSSVAREVAGVDLRIGFWARVDASPNSYCTARNPESFIRDETRGMDLHIGFMNSNCTPGSVSGVGVESRIMDDKPCTRVLNVDCPSKLSGMIRDKLRVIDLDNCMFSKNCSAFRPAAMCEGALPEGEGGAAAFAEKEPALAVSI